MTKWRIQDMGFKMTNGWTEDRVTLLKKLWTDGLSASQIAKQLGGVTRNAVIGKVHRLGLAGRATPSRPIKRLETPVLRVRPVLQASLPAAESIQAHVHATSQHIVSVEALSDAAMIAPHVASGACDHGVPLSTLKVAKPTARPPRSSEIIGVLGLGPNMCKWPIGDPGDPDFGFCGSHCGSAAVYCEEHAAIAFQPAQSRRPGVTRDDRVASEARRLARLANY
jgi:GcrA cell cycle regulator